MTRAERLEKLMRLIKRGLDTGKIKDVSLIEGDKVHALSDLVTIALQADK